MLWFWKKKKNNPSAADIEYRKLHKELMIAIAKLEGKANYVNELQTRVSHYHGIADIVDLCEAEKELTEKVNNYNEKRNNLALFVKENDQNFITTGKCDIMNKAFDPNEIIKQVREKKFISQ